MLQGRVSKMEHGAGHNQDALVRYYRLYSFDKNWIADIGFLASLLVQRRLVMSSN